MGKLWCDLCENQDENWPRYNGTALYSYFMQISHVSCIWPSGCPCLFILNTRHNRRFIFCPGSFCYCKHRFIPIQYVFMFWNRNLVFKLTTIDVPSGLQARNFKSSVIHHHEFSLIGKFADGVAPGCCMMLIWADQWMPGVPRIMLIKQKPESYEFPIIAPKSGTNNFINSTYFPPTQTQVHHSFRSHFIQAHLVTQLGPFVQSFFVKSSKWNAHLLQTFMKISKSNTHLVFTYTECLSPMLI